MFSFLAGDLSPNVASTPTIKAMALRPRLWIQEIFLHLMENICRQFSGFGGHFNPGCRRNRAFAAMELNFPFL